MGGAFEGMALARTPMEFKLSGHWVPACAGMMGAEQGATPWGIGDQTVNERGGLDWRVNDVGFPVGSGLADCGRVCSILQRFVYPVFDRPLMVSSRRSFVDGVPAA